MKHPWIKTMLVAGMALAPVAGMAQSKGGAAPESPNAPLLKNEGERKAGERPGRPSPEERAKRLTAMFDRLDADGNGSLSREEFSKMGTRQPRKNGVRPGKNASPEQRKAAEERKDAAEKAAEDRKDAADRAAAEAEAKNPDKTRTTGSTGGTGSSASGSQADGSAATGTVTPKP